MNIQLIKRTSLTLLLTAIAGFSLHAGDMKADKMKMKEGVCMMEGKMMHVDAEGKCTMMDKTMTMPDGTKVMKDGECKMKDGQKMKMKDGEMMTMDSKVSVMDETTKASVMEQSKQK